MSARPFFHVYRLLEFPSAEEASADAKLHQEILDCLAEKFHVLVRRAPAFERDMEFGSNTTKFYSIARYSVTNAYLDHPVGSHILKEDSAAAMAWHEEYD